MLRWIALSVGLCLSLPTYAEEAITPHTGDVFVRSSPTAPIKKLTYTTPNGFVSFSLPNKWVLRQVNGRLPLAFSVFQVPDTDNGTKDTSSDFIILLYEPYSDVARSIATTTAGYTRKGVSTESYKTWTIYNLTEQQDGETITKMEAHTTEADVRVSAGLSWQNPNHDRAYDAQMRARFLTILDSVDGQKAPYHLETGETLIAAGGLNSDQSARLYPRRTVMGGGDSVLKATGIAEIIEGKVEYGKAIFRQPMTYSKTGVLTSDVRLKHSWKGYIMPANTHMYGYVRPDYKGVEYTLWCNIPTAKVREVCFPRTTDTYFWEDSPNGALKGDLGLIRDSLHIDTPQVKEQSFDVTPIIMMEIGLDYNSSDRISYFLKYLSDGNVLYSVAPTFSEPLDVIFTGNGTQDAHVSYNKKDSSYTVAKISHADAIKLVSSQNSEPIPSPEPSK